MLRYLYEDHRQSSIYGRVWVKSQGLQAGEEDYFMNFWAFLGGYLHGLAELDAPGDFDGDSDVEPTHFLATPNSLLTNAQRRALIFPYARL